MLRAKYFCLQVLQILPGIGFKKKSETGERPPHPPQFIHVTILLVLTHIYKMKWTGEAFIHPIITPILSDQTLEVNIFIILDVHILKFIVTYLIIVIIFILLFPIFA